MKRDNKYHYIQFRMSPTVVTATVQLWFVLHYFVTITNSHVPHTASTNTLYQMVTLPQWKMHNLSILTNGTLLLHLIYWNLWTLNTISSYSEPEKNTVAAQVRQNRRRTIIEPGSFKPTMMSSTTSQPNCIWQDRRWQRCWEMWDDHDGWWNIRLELWDLYFE